MKPCVDWEGWCCLSGSGSGSGMISILSFMSDCECEREGVCLSVCFFSEWHVVIELLVCWLYQSIASIEMN